MTKIQITQTFLDLVSIDSPSGHEEKITAYIEHFLTKLDILHSRDTYGNLIAKLPGFGKSLLLSAHMDTVEPGRNINPIIQKDGLIKSSNNTILGADNKAALAAILETLSIIKQKKLRHQSIEIVFTKSEEVGNFGAVNLDYSSISAKQGYVFDNPSPLGTIITASPFYSRFDIKIIGKDAHASKPEEAINALQVFAKAFSAIKIGKVSQETLVNIGIARTGHVRNTIPGIMELSGEVRSYVEAEIDDITQSIMTKFQQAAQIHAAAIESTIVRENSGYKYSDNDTLIRKTSSIMQKNHLKPVLKTTWGCSDANIFREKGIKVLDLGDGSQNAHTLNESISIENLVKLSNLMLFLITEKG